MVVPALFDAAPWVPLALLFVTIALFKVSTLQMRWPFRLLAWIAGMAGLVAAATLSIAARDNFGVWRALGDIAAHLEDPTQSLVWLAISQNLKTLPDYLSPVTDFALLIVGLAGIGALIAFTPGHRWERFTRGALIGVIGGVIGALMTVAVVALGFGGEAHRAVLVGSAGEGGDVSVLDGDTIKIGATTIRLYGLEAPELRQTCGAERRDCGARAREALLNLVDGRLVECQAQVTRNGTRVETFGRPLMRCWVDGQDLTELMISQGEGIQYRDAENPEDLGYAWHEIRARAENKGIWTACFYEPGEWRRNRRLRTETFPALDAPSSCQPQGLHPSTPISPSF